MSSENHTSSNNNNNRNSKSPITPLSTKALGTNNEIAVIKNDNREVSVKAIDSNSNNDNDISRFFHSNARPPSERDLEAKDIKFQYLVNEMMKKIRSEKYSRGGNLTYSANDDSSNIFSDLTAGEERQVIAAAREKIKREDEEAKRLREEREIDQYRRLQNLKEHCPDCSFLVGYGYGALDKHRQNCTLYQKRVLKEEEDRKLRENHLSRYNYLFERIDSLTTELTQIKKLIGDIKIVESEAYLDRNKAILEAQAEAQNKIRNEEQKRRDKPINDLDSFTNTFEKWINGVILAEKEEKEKEKEKQIVSASTTTTATR